MIITCGELLWLDPMNDQAYALFSGTYSRSGKLDKVASLRKVMRDSGLKKEQSCSLIEVNGNVQEFVVAHRSSRKIYKLDEVMSRLKSMGNVPDKSKLLQLVEEVKQPALHIHSKKLAN